MQQPEFQHVQPSQLHVSTTGSQFERRMHLDAKGIDELAESIATVGILQPIVVRPITNGQAYSPDQETFEIVAGERRWLAAKKAGLKTVPVNVRTLTDEQVLEVQLVENLQRADIHPMAEAEGYEALRKIGRTADEIADKVGKSKASVYARMKLLDLCQAGRKAFYAADLDASRALLIARIGGDKHQERALKVITEKGWKDRVMSYREAADYVHENFMLKLSAAPFPREDVTLVPSAGACGACPMRTGNQPELFGDVKGADVCTSPPCFASKKAAFQKRGFEHAKETGQTVIKGPAAKRILPNTRSYNSQDREQMRGGYVRPTDKCLDDAKKRTYAQLAGKDAPITLIQDPENGKMVRAIELDAIKPQLTVAGIKAPKKAENKEQAREQNQAQRDLAKKTELAARAALFQAVRAAAPKKLDRTAVTELIVHELDQYSYEENLWSLLGWPPCPQKTGYEKYIRTCIAALSDGDMAQLAAVAVLIEQAVDNWGKAEELTSLAKKLGVDVKAARDAAAPVIEPDKKSPAAKSKAKGKK